MKCPLLKAGFYANSSDDVKCDIDCLKEECAWWSDEKNCCSMKVIAKEVTSVHFKLGDIAMMMPFKATL